MSRLQLNLLALTSLNLVFAYFVVAYEHHHLHAENGLLENLQAMLLALGTVIFLTPQREGLPLPSLRLAFALLCFSFMLRELDVERFDIPALLQWLGSGSGKRILLLVLWALVSWRIYREVRSEGFDRDGLLYSRQALCMPGVLVLLGISLVMDQEILSMDLSRFYEELAETNAYLLLVGSRYVHLLPLRPVAAAHCVQNLKV